MCKRYQVFISSTYKDLKEERRAVSESIIDLKCFPASMEYFPARSQEQFEYIKKIIDESDYYILVLAGRYGTPAEDGISYTEKEYDYALEKGIPILVFVRKSIDDLTGDNIEISIEGKYKLEQFRKKAMKNRLVKEWLNAEELRYAVSLSLRAEFDENPQKGWVRAKENDEYIAPLINFNEDEPKGLPNGSLWLGGKW